MQARTRLLLLTVALAAVLAAGMAGPAAAQTTWTVDTLQDVVDEADGYLSLREALAAAGAGDTIDITVAGTITLDVAAGPLRTGTSVAINGPGQELLTVSGGNAVPVLWVGVDASGMMVPGAVVSVSGLTIADGFAAEDGLSGGIANACTLTLTDCTLTRNTGMWGGALVSLGPAELTGCTLSNNTASGLETGSMTGMGGAVLNAATMTLTDCQLTGNTATQAGGAIFSGLSGAASPAVLTLSRCVLSSNAVTGPGASYSYWAGGGGAICNGGYGCTATLTVEDSLLTGNSAWLGGALVSYAYTDSDGEWSIGPPGTATASIVRSTLSDNVVSADGTEALGGAIAQLSLGDSASLATLTVDSSTLSGNSAASLTAGAVGGALASLGGDDSMVSVRNSTLAGNGVVGSTGVGDAFGGAMVLFGGTLTVDNSTLSGNFCRAHDGSAADGASGIVNGWGEVAIKNTILANDAAGANLVAADTYSTITSYGYNLSTDDGSGLLTAAGDQTNTAPLLGPLADNGGPTWTCALLAGSPAIDMADAYDGAGSLVEFDQRGVARPQGGFNDIGAFELEPSTNQPPILDVTSAPATGVVGTPVTFTATATDPNEDALTFSLGTDAPEGAGIDPDTGAFSWTPAATGTFSFDVIVTDTGGLSDTETVAVEVSALAVSEASATCPSAKSPIVTVTVTIANPSTTDTAYAVTVTAATLGGVDTNSRLPLIYGAIKPGESKQCKLQFKTVPPGEATLVVEGTCSLGNFSTTQTVAVP